MKDVFNITTADFSRITALDRLKIDLVLQSAFIDVKESGTEGTS